MLCLLKVDAQFSTITLQPMEEHDVLKFVTGTVSQEVRNASNI
jgi:hypothetical protein